LAIEYIGNGEIAEQKKGLWLSNNCIHMTLQIWEKNFGTRAEHVYKIWEKKKKKKGKEPKEEYDEHIGQFTVPSFWSHKSQ
jgi:hypothetical protein